MIFLDDETGRTGQGLCGGILLLVSWCLFLVTLPFSLLVCFKVLASNLTRRESPPPEIVECEELPIRF